MLCSCSQLFFSETWEIGVSQHPSHRQHPSTQGGFSGPRTLRPIVLLFVGRSLWANKIKYQSQEHQPDYADSLLAQQGESRDKKKVTRCEQPTKYCNKTASRMSIFEDVTPVCTVLVPSCSIFIHVVPFCSICHLQVLLHSPRNHQALAIHCAVQTENTL